MSYVCGIGGFSAELATPHTGQPDSAAIVLSGTPKDWIVYVFSDALQLYQHVLAVRRNGTSL